MKIKSIIFLLITSHFAFGEVNLDSLEAELQNVSGKQKVKLLTDLCWEYGAVDTEKAEKYGNEAVKLSIEDNYDTLLAQSYNDLGTLYLRIGNYDKAIELYNLCIKKRTELNDDLGIAKVLSKLAVLDELRSDYAASLAKNLQVLKIFETLGSDKSAISTLYGNISVILYNMNQIEKSLEFNQKGYDLAVEINDKKLIGGAFVNFGNAYSKNNEVDKALFYFKKALPIFKETQNINSVAVIYNNIGTCYSNMQMLDSAEYYFNISIDYRIKLNDLKGVMSTKSSLGNIYTKQGAYTKALNVLNEALEISIQLQTKENTKIIYLNLSELYNAKKEFDKAYLYHVKFSQIKDSIWSDESSKIITEMETKYETEKKDAEISLLNKENALEKETIKRQQIQLYGTGFGILLLIGLSITIFRSYNQKKKANEIITQQNEELNQYNEEILAQRDEIETQKNLIEGKHNEIQSSINYAKRIQNALLDNKQSWDSLSDDYFILFKPRDIVSGDFYWAYTDDKYAIWAVADCTGHGVPGAFMSMLGISFLNEIVAEGGEKDASNILNKLKEKVVNALTQHGNANQTKDGMDIALCVLDKKNNKLQFAGAYNPLYIVRNGNLIEYKASKQPIGKMDVIQAPFNKNEIEVQNGDWLYTFSDGFIDQFGGSNNKRFGSKQFKELLISMQNQNAHIQKMTLNLTLKEWMKSGGEEQVDDICIVGVKII